MKYTFKKFKELSNNRDYKELFIFIFTFKLTNFAVFTCVMNKVKNNFHFSNKQ